MNTDIYDAFLSGDPRGLNIIILTWRDPLIKFARQFVRTDAAEDAVSEAFCALSRKIGKFDNKSHITGFLYSVVKNKCVDEYDNYDSWFSRRTESMSLLELSSEEKLTTYNEWIVDTVRVQLEKLDKIKREDFRAYFFDSKSYKEIAKARRVTEGNVRTNVSLAVKIIRKYLKDNPYPGS